MVEKVNNMLNGHLKNESTKPNEEANELNFIRHKLESFRTAITKDVEKRISIMVDEVMQELRQHELQLQEFKNFANLQPEKSKYNTWKNRAAEESLANPIEENDDRTNLNKNFEIQSNTKFDNCKPKEKDTNAKQKKSQNQKSLHALPNKVFVTRESYLTVLLKVDHMRVIYHIFHIIFLVLCLHTVAHDYFVEGKINLGLGTCKAGFKRIHYVLGVWLLQHGFVFLLYYAFRIWSYIRTKLQKQTALQRFWSHSCLITYIASQLVFGYVASVLCLKFDLPFVSASVLLLESTRLLMKMHAFVRTNAARVLSNKLKCDSDIDAADSTTTATVRLAPFSWYLYFLFAPTLVYQDSYPRTSHIRWKFVLARFLEGLAVAFLFSYLHERYMEVHFLNYGREPITASALVVKYFGMCMPSIIIFLGGFFLILHAWLNFTSELLRFGDRMFYKDWWTAYNFDTYYRNWNVVVHDWLYEYIYKDTYKYLFRGSKTASSLLVFAISAIVHEYILGFAMQLFFPVMFFCFGLIGVICVFLTRRATKNIGNIFLWFSLITGNSFMISLYYMEYYARQNCHVTDRNGWSDVLIPMIWKCRS